MSEVAQSCLILCDPVDCSPQQSPSSALPATCQMALTNHVMPHRCLSALVGDEVNVSSAIRAVNPVDSRPVPLRLDLEILRKRTRIQKPFHVGACPQDCRAVPFELRQLARRLGRDRMGDRRQRFRLLPVTLGSFSGCL